MTKVFADTSFCQALFSKRDSAHERARQWFGESRATIVTSDYILLELGSLMSRGRARSLFVDFVACLQSDPSTEVIPASPELLEAGLMLFAERPDKEWSLTDCTSFVLMRRSDVDDALTTDHHFEQAGFHSLLS